MLNKQNFFGKRDETAPGPQTRPAGYGAQPTSAPASPASSSTVGAGSAAASPAPAPLVEPKPLAAPPAAPRIEPEGSRLIVGPGIKLKGAEIQDCDTLVVEGRVEATMDSRVIQIAEKGSFAGKVNIDVAEIRGRFEGELTARKQLVIHSSGHVSGKIRYGKIVIQEGGELSGDIKSLGAEGAAGDLLDLSDSKKGYAPKAGAA